MKLINLSVVAAAFFVYGCEEKKEFKIQTPIEMCIEKGNLPRALCECINDTSKEPEKTVNASQNQSPEGSENLMHEHLEAGSEVGQDGTINEDDTISHDYGNQESRWNMKDAMERASKEMDARFEECLKTMEIK